MVAPASWANAVPLGTSGSGFDRPIFHVEGGIGLFGSASIDSVGLERARHQIAVRALFTHERPSRRLEATALDLFVFGRVRSREEVAASVAAVTADQVRNAFEQMLASRASVAVAGKLGKGLNDRVRGLMAS